MMLRWIHIKDWERGLLFRDGNFAKRMGPGKHLVKYWFGKTELKIVDMREVFLEIDEREIVARSGKLGAEAKVLDLAEYERAFIAVDGKFVRILAGGLHVLWTGFRKVEVARVDTREVYMAGKNADLIARSGLLGGEAIVLELAQNERALVRVDGRVDRLLGAGRTILWTTHAHVEVERFDARDLRVPADKAEDLFAAASAAKLIGWHFIEAGHVGLLYLDGAMTEALRPGLHGFWAGRAKVRVDVIETRERRTDIDAQEIMTADRVTLRLNATLAFRVTDPEKAAAEVDSVEHALYREAQLALREVIGGLELDALLAAREDTAARLEVIVRDRSAAFGIEVTGFGIRDVILPGEMKSLLNRVTEARKAAEANLIHRREETAAMRSQANTAKLLDSNPTLMRLRELELLEKIAGSTNLKVVLGEKGLSERMLNLL